MFYMRQLGRKYKYLPTPEVMVWQQEQGMDAHKGSLSSLYYILTYVILIIG